MNIRGLIATSIAFCTLAACTHTPNQTPTVGNWQKNTGTRAVASEDNLNRQQALQHLSDGIPFGLGCAKEPGKKTTVWLDFYATDEANNPLTQRYTDSYIDIVRLIKESSSATNTIPGGKNRIINSSGFKYMITPSSIRIDDGKGHGGTYIADIRKPLADTCASAATEKDLEEYGSEFGFTADETYLPVSIVGPYISIQYSSSSYMGGAHPSSYVSFVSRNAASVAAHADQKNTFEAAKYSLFDVASEGDILAALKGDKFLQKRLGAGNLAATKNTSAVHQLMVKKLSGDCEISIPSDKTEAFGQLAIYDYDAAKGNVLVRVGYSYGCEAARGNFTQLGLSLKPLPQFAAYLQAEVKAAATEGRKPYFMRYSQQLK